MYKFLHKLRLEAIGNACLSPVESSKLRKLIFLLLRSQKMVIKILLWCLPTRPLILIMLSTAKLKANCRGELQSLRRMCPSIFHLDFVTLSERGVTWQRAYKYLLLMIWGYVIFMMRLRCLLESANNITISYHHAWRFNFFRLHFFLHDWKLKPGLQLSSQAFISCKIFKIPQWPLTC